MTNSLFVKNARLIDGLADQPIDGASILVTGDRIEEIFTGPRPDPDGAEVVDLQGKTVVPGLIDTHVHMTLMDPRCYPLFLAAGVTSARDVGGKLESVLRLRGELEAGERIGPRLLVYGPLLDGAVKSVDLPFFREMTENVAGPEEVPKKVGRILEAGADGVKLYFTMPPETTKAAIEFVDKRVPVTGHVGYTHSIDAINAGIDGLEHAWISPYNDFCALDMQYGPPTLMGADWYMHTARGWAGADLDSKRARSWFDAMVEKQVALGTTHVVLVWATAAGPEFVRNDPDWRYAVPGPHLEQMASPELGTDADGEIDPTAIFFDPHASPLPEVLDKMHALTAQLREAGGVVVGGTDCGAIHYPPPGYSLLREVELLAESIGSMKAIQAVTSAAARHLRREQDIGSRWQPGRYADFLVIDGDPLRHTRELREVATVYRGGKPHKPEELLALVPQGARRAGGLGRQSLQQFPGGLAAVGIERTDHDLIGAGLQVLVHALAHRRQVAPGDRGIHEPVAGCPRPVRFVKTPRAPQPVVGRQRQIHLQGLARPLTGAFGIAAHRQHCSSTLRRLSGTEDAPGLCGMGGGAQIGIGTIRLLGCDLQQFGTVRRNPDRSGLRGGRGLHLHRLDSFQIGAHLLGRRRPGLLVRLRHRRMRDAESECEAPVGKFRQRLALLRGDDGVVRVHVGNAGGDAQLAGAREQECRGRIGIAPEKLRYPERVVAELFNAMGKAHEVGHR